MLVHCVVQADPAEVLNVPVIPVGALLAAAHPLASRPPYFLSWLSSQISAQGLMNPKLLDKLVLNSFCEYNYLSSTKILHNLLATKCI